MKSLTRTITITVTPEHIKNAQPRNPCNCPIALALKDNGFLNPYVSRQITWDHGGYKYSTFASEAVLSFIVDFDSGHVKDPNVMHLFTLYPHKLRKLDQ